VEVLYRYGLDGERVTPEVRAEVESLRRLTTEVH
jgi:hypothetical protein